MLGRVGPAGSGTALYAAGLRRRIPSSRLISKTNAVLGALTTWACTSLAVSSYEPRPKTCSDISEQHHWSPTPFCPHAVGARAGLAHARAAGPDEREQTD